MLDLKIHYSWISERIIEHEGLRLSPYKCSRGKNTVGVGHNLDAHPIPDEYKRMCPEYPKITLDVAYILLRRDLTEVVDFLQKQSWCNDLDIERQYAIIDMTFQLGTRGILKFKKMIAALKVKDYEKAAAECLDSSYHKQTPKRCKRIAALIKTGEWKA